MPRLRPQSVHVAALAILLSRVGVAQAGSTRPAAPPVIDIRLAATQPSAGFSRMEGLNVPDQPRVIYVDRASIVSDSDVILARSKPTADGLALSVYLSDAAATRLRELTSKSIGQHLAVFAHGKLAGVAVIMSTVPRENHISIGLTLPAAVSDTVSSRVAVRWPRPRP